MVIYSYNRSELWYREDRFTDHQTSLLKLGPKSVPTQKRIPYMEIITATESVALNLEYHNKEANAES